MSNIVRYIKSTLSMSRKESLFTDKISGRTVWRYVDCYGVEWMANYPYIPMFSFRTERP